MRKYKGKLTLIYASFSGLDSFDVDVGSSPKDWDTITVQRNDIVRVLEE